MNLLVAFCTAVEKYVFGAGNRAAARACLRPCYHAKQHGGSRQPVGYLAILLLL
jgi:hypothetical protein